MILLFNTCTLPDQFFVYVYKEKISISNIQKNQLPNFTQKQVKGKLFVNTCQNEFPVTTREMSSLLSWHVCT